MTPRFSELDYQRTPLGELVLRRRLSSSVPDSVVFEVTLDGEMLMSSAVNASERALARLALDGTGERPCDVLVGGLGLGYTAATVLEYPSVRRLVVLELLAPVIAWHRNRLVPMAGILVDDARCSLIECDFFLHVGPGSTVGRELHDVILLDIDHSPESWLHSRHGDFYGVAGLRGLADRLRPDGVFGLWTATEPPAKFLELLNGVFRSVVSHEIPFFNPHLDEKDSNWVVIARSVARGR